MPEGLGFPSECRKVCEFPSECRKVSGFRLGAGRSLAFRLSAGRSLAFHLSAGRSLAFPSGCRKVCGFPSGCRKVCEFPYLKFLVGSIRFVGRLTCHAKQYYELLYLFQVVLPCCLHLVMKTLFQSYLYLQYT